MNILEKLKIEVARTGVRRLDEFDRGVLQLDFEKLPPSSATYDIAEEYLLTGKIIVRFYAKDGMFESSLRHAKRVLINRLYGDTLAELDELRLAIGNGDRKIALQICKRIEDLLTT
jgi:hypothetical protein